MHDPEFQHLIHAIVHSDEYQHLKRQRHHLVTSVYDHSLKVAYLLYRHHKRYRLKTDLYELVRGALLHDYYLYDRQKKTHKRHLTRHPKKALQNAVIAYPNLTRTERDMIGRHMFPVTLRPPRTAGGWLICFYDKVAAVHDLVKRK